MKEAFIEAVRIPAHLLGINPALVHICCPYGFLGSDYIWSNHSHRWGDIKVKGKLRTEPLP